jgi:hypothetical protein
MTTTSTLTVTEFVLARIKEDEAAARVDLDGDAWGNPYSEGTGIELTFTAERVLAQCAAMRKIVEHCVEQAHYTDTPPDAVFTIRALASIWADHPDWREEWR